MSRAHRAALAVCSVLTVAGAVVAGAAPSASAGISGAQAPLRGQLAGVSCASATSCMAVGGRLGDQWDGARWSVVPVRKPAAGTGPSLNAVSCTAPTSCMAIGNFSNKRVLAPLAERWNGTTWTMIPVPQGGFAAPDLSGVSCATAGSCAAVGCELHGDFCASTIAYEWNGTAWRPEPTPAGTGQLTSVSCASPSSCMAVGTGAGGGLAERWNGQRWSAVPVPSPAHSQLLELNGVSCLAAGCEAVGDYANKLGGIVTLAERWNGHAWSIQRSPNPPGALVGLDAVSCSAASACTAVGNYDNNTGQTLSTALRWNGTAWTRQSPANPRTKPFVVVTLSGVSCPAVTSCTTVGGNVFGSEGATNALAEGWNGTRWAIEPTPAGAH